MKTIALQAMIDSFKEAWPEVLPSDERLREEAQNELRVLVDEAAWLNAAEEEIARLKAQIAVKDGVLRQALEWSRYVAASRRENTQEFLDDLFPTGEKLQEELQAALLPSNGKVLIGGRVAKLVQAGKEFLVVGEHEPYYKAVYEIIRDNEKLQGTWSVVDEARYREAVCGSTTDRAALLKADACGSDKVLVDRDLVDELNLHCCEGCGAWFTGNSQEAIQGWHETTETVRGPDDEPEPSQAQCGPITKRKLT